MENNEYRKQCIHKATDTQGQYNSVVYKLLQQ